MDLFVVAHIEAIMYHSIRLAGIPPALLLWLGVHVADMMADELTIGTNSLWNEYLIISQLTKVIG